LDCYKISRFSNGGAPVEYLINLPIDELSLQISTVNKAAEQEEAAIKAQGG